MSAFTIIFFLGIVGAAVGFFFWFRRVARERLTEGLRMKLFLIELPRRVESGGEGGSGQEALLQEIARFEQLIAALASGEKSFAFEIAVPYVGEEIHFYAAVPRELAEPFERQVYALWGDAKVIHADDYNVFHYGGAVAGAVVRLKARFLLPLRTYRELQSDTFLPILGGLTKVNAVGEGCAVQYVLRPAPKSAKRELKGALEALRKGMSFSHLLEVKKAALADVRRAFAPEKKEEKPGMPSPPRDERAEKLLEAKLTKPLFEVNGRLIASAPTLHRAEELLSEMSAGFSALEAPDRNGFKFVRPRDIHLLVRQFSFREFSPPDAMVLGAEELASICHVPTTVTAVPRLRAVKSREAPPPVKLPARGVLLGESVYRGERRPVRLAEEDRRRHLYLVGQTGTGKSTLITSLVAQDMAEGRGCAVIDPHGDLVERLLGLVPPKRWNDVVLFDPSDLERPIGVNMIEYDHRRPEEKTFIVNELLGIFDKLYDLRATGGPMFEQYMRNALLLLMEDAAVEPATLMEIPRVFTDAAFRARKLARITNPIVQDFWEKEATKTSGEAALANITPYVTSKFVAFTANDYMRVIVGQTHSAFNFRSLMDEGKIFLVNLTKGKIGDLNASLLGMIITGKLLMAALGRSDIPEAQRRDFYLAIDEFQNFTTDSIATILSEARKYRLNLTIAHQFLGQLTEKIRDAVFGNVGSLLVFRVGAPDAEVLAKQLGGGVFTPSDLTNLDNFRGVLKLLVEGETTPAFSLGLVPPPRGDEAKRGEIRERSRVRYGKPREEVEREIRERLRN